MRKGITFSKAATLCTSWFLALWSFVAFVVFVVFVVKNRMKSRIASIVNSKKMPL
jgi:hypothetical protein